MESMEPTSREDFEALELVGDTVFTIDGKDVAVEALKATVASRRPGPYGYKPPDKLDLSWQGTSACTGIGNELFFPGRGNNLNEINKTKAICEICPVKVKCLNFAIENNEKDGIWGGTTPDERKALRKRRKNTAA